MRNSDANERFGSLLDQCELELLEVEPTSHMHVLTQKIADAAVEAFVPTKAAPRQPWMSAMTFAFVREIKGVSKDLRRAGRWIATAGKRFAFMFWATCAGHARGHLCTCTVVRGFARHGLTLLRARLTVQLWGLEQSFESYSKMDKLVWLNERAEKQSRA